MIMKTMMVRMKKITIIIKITKNDNANNGQIITIMIITINTKITKLFSQDSKGSGAACTSSTGTSSGFTFNVAIIRLFWMVIDITRLFWMIIQIIQNDEVFLINIRNRKYDNPDQHRRLEARSQQDQRSQIGQTAPTDQRTRQGGRS